MKVKQTSKIFLINLILVFSFASSQESFAQSISKHIEKLQAYIVSNSKNPELDNGYELVKNAVHSAITSNINDEQLKSLYEVVYILLEADPSHYAAEVVYPLYQQKNSQSLKAINTLTDKKQELIKASMRNFIRELKEGNG
ncbi:MAG: hypothetical protein H6625_11220 [Bdellovibrionaceae bacterium]|nr:hypothetical protein [Pseudobdellovibrionaceae bacterium]